MDTTQKYQQLTVRCRLRCFYHSTQTDSEWAGLTEHSEVSAGSGGSDHHHISALVSELTVLDVQCSPLAVADHLVFVSGLQLPVVLQPFDLIGFLGDRASELCLLTLHHLLALRPGDELSSQF